MNNLKLFESFLESNFSPLYHWTDKIAPILFSDMLKAHPNHFDDFDIGSRKDVNMVTHKTISFTRDKLFRHLLTTDAKHFRLVLNSDKMRDNYKIRPFDAFSSPHKYDNSMNIGKANTTWRTSTYTDNEDERVSVEFEEVILDRNVKPLHKYITAIQVCKYHKMSIQQASMIERYCSAYPNIELHLIDIKNLQDKPVKITPNLLLTNE